jgi:heat shock protein beta
MKLYVRKVLISDEFDLMPRYLSFIRGVVDSDDLPLNVNRETLQESKIIQVVKKKLVRKAIEMIRKFSQEEGKPAEIAEAEIDADGNVEEKEQESVPPPYNAWYKKFGQSIKMGIIDDEPNRGKLSKLLRFDSSKSDDDDMISLEDYVGRMKDWQTEIYVFAGVSKADLETSHFMEKFNEKDLEVIYLTETVDEYMVQNMREFDGKKFTPITKDGLKFNDEDEDLMKRRDKYYKKQLKPLTKWLKQIYGPAVMKISISKRLGSTPAIVSSSEYGNSANMERIMRAQAFNGADESQIRAMRILEINPRHPVIHKLLDGCPPEDEEEAKEFVISDEIVDSAWMMFDMAMLNGGFPIDDKEAYSTRTMRLLKSQMGLESLALEDEVNPPVEEEEAPEIDLDGLGAAGINLDDYPGIMNMDDFDV